MTTVTHPPKKGYRTVRLPLAESEYDRFHCTGQKIRIADIVDKYDVLVPPAHSRAVPRLRVVPLACLGDLGYPLKTGQFAIDRVL